MVDDSFISSIVLAAVILLGFFTVLSVIGFLFFFFGIFPFLIDPMLSSHWMRILWPAVLPTALSSFVGVILLIVWLGWRQNPSEHRQGLVITGIIALVCCGIVPGILAIVAGAMEPQIAKPYTLSPPTLPKPVEKHYCPSCGAEASPTDLYCWKCGSALNS